jgi:tetratricopeptide (TPR) repeat protein
MAANLQRKLRAVHANLQAGDWAGAERLCRELLARAPKNPDALHLLGAARLGAGHPGEAAVHIGTALQLDARNPVMLEHLGLAKLALRDYPAAETAFRRALQSGASHALLYMRLGMALHYQARLGEALTALRAAAAEAPEDPDVLLNLGNALAADGQADAALECYRKATALHPDRANAHFNAGAQLRRMGRLEEAETALRAALAADPRHADACHELGSLSRQQDRREDAVSWYRRAIALDPGHIAARNNLGNVLVALGRIGEAEPVYLEAAGLRPDHPDAFLNLGNVRGHQRRFAEAQRLFEKAIALDPQSYDAHYNLGDALWGQGRMEEAAAAYERSLSLNAGFAGARYNLGVLQLLRQDYDRGWAGFERRCESPDVRRAVRQDEASLAFYERLPRWRGPGEPGVRDVAIWAEQGIGDQVLFSTLIPELIAAAVPFVYEVDRRLLAAYERALPGARFLPMSDPPHAELQQASRVLLAGSLPFFFRRSRDDFSRQPRALLSPLPDRLAHYRQRLSEGGAGRAVALSWRSSRKDWLGPDKSASLMDFLPFLQTGGLQFVDVQYGDTAGERQEVAARGARLRHFDDVDYFNDLEELLAIIGACDLLVTTSNVNAHLAGALGKPAWLLYPADRAPFHYWAHGGSGRSVWYPSVEIVTAPHLSDWASLLRHAADKLGLDPLIAGRR